MAVIGATQLEPVNVLGSYVQGLEAGRAARAQRAKEAQAMQLQNMLMGATPEQLESPEFINRLTVMPGGAEIAKTLSESAAAQRTARKEDLDIAIKQGEVIAREAGAFLDDPASLSKATIDAWAQNAVQRGLLSQEAYARFQQLPDDPNVLGPAMQRLQTQGLSLADQLRYQRVTPEAMLPYEQALSPDVEAQRIRIAGAGASRTTIQLPGRKRGEELEKLGAADLAAEYNAVKSAARGLQKDYETLRLLREGKPSTGITSEIEVGLNRIKADIGGDREAAERVSDSQYLEALLGSDVFQQMSALGVGARGLDTPAEREFLREVVSGTRKLDKDTLIRMAEMRAKYKEDLVQDYNARIESGELDDFFENYGRPKRTFNLPERPQAPSEPAAFATEAEAEAAFKAGRIKKGDRITIGGVSGRWE
jgi:hypothetical protein